MHEGELDSTIEFIYHKFIQVNGSPSIQEKIHFVSWLAGYTPECTMGASLELEQLGEADIVAGLLGRDS